MIFHGQPAFFFKKILRLPWKIADFHAFGVIIAFSKKTSEGAVRRLLFFCLSFLPFSVAIADDALWESAAVQAFIKELANTHSHEELKSLFVATQKNERVLELVAPKNAPRNWEKYRKNFVNPLLVLKGAQFLKKHAATFKTAEERYGVPREIITAIIGIETQFGKTQGSFSTFEVLATLGFYDERRADFFKNELKEFLLFCKENHFEPLKIKGSYAGALGIAQFMPSSIRKYAVDFDGDGNINLSQSEIDAIGSVAAFLEKHGWEKNAPIAFPADVSALKENVLKPFLEGGIAPAFLVKDLKTAGVKTTAPDNLRVSVLNFDSPDSVEYWLGAHNLEVISFYNRSRFYALSVFLLALELQSPF